MNSTSDAKPHTLPKDALLILDARKQHVSVNFEQPNVTIGRDARNRIVINHPKVSRIHARVEMHQDRFILIDQSTNGTYIHPDGGVAIELKRETWTLKGDGIIYLGKEATPNSRNAIHYQIL